MKLFENSRWNYRIIGFRFMELCLIILINMLLLKILYIINNMIPKVLLMLYLKSYVLFVIDYGIWSWSWCFFLFWRHKWQCLLSHERMNSFNPLISSPSSFLWLMQCINIDSNQRITSLCLLLVLLLNFCCSVFEKICLCNWRKHKNIYF